MSLLAALMTLVGAQHDRHNCVRMFQHHNAGGWEEKIDASRRTANPGEWYYWDDRFFDFHCNMFGTGANCRNNAVSSFKVPSGCYFLPACNKNFQYEMDMFVGPKYINLVGSWDDCITSYRCWCAPTEYREYTSAYGYYDWLVAQGQGRRRIAGGKNSTESTVPPLSTLDLLDEELDVQWETYTGRKNASTTNTPVLEGALEGIVRDMLANPTYTDAHRDELIIDIEKALFLERHPETATPPPEGSDSKKDKKAKRKAKRKLQKAALKERLAADASSD